MFTRNIFVEDLRSIHFLFSVICLQETWKADDDFSKKNLMDMIVYYRGLNIATKEGY